MKNKHLWLCAILCVCALCLFTAACNGTDPTAEGTDTQESTVTVEEATEADTAATEPETEPETEPPFLVCENPAEGESVSLLTDLMTDWASKYRKGRLDKTWEIIERCEPVGVTLTWSCQGDPLYYHVYIADNASLYRAEKYLVAQPSLFLNRLYMGTDYYWRVDATMENPDKPGEPGEIVSSEVWHFSTMALPRTMAVDGVSNVRDIGGYTTADGLYRVKQGMAYRGAELNHITQAGINEMLYRLEIATELDVRGASQTKSTLGETVNYFSVNAPWYSHAMDDEYKKAVVDEMRVFVDSDNYPIFFHCSLGRDRTGTLAFMLGCVLNVPENDLYMDYETTFFSDFGGYVDTAKPSQMIAQLVSFGSSVKSHTGEKNLHDAMCAYLIELGMTQEELDAIRANLLEEIPQQTEKGVN